MAREMTPQERAAAPVEVRQALANKVKNLIVSNLTHKENQLWLANVDAFEERAYQRGRRAALLEAAQRVGLGDCNSLLDAPCLWCGYNGSGYYQAGTHDQSCIWRDVGGERERIDRLAQEG